MVLLAKITFPDKTPSNILIGVIINLGPISTSVNSDPSATTSKFLNKILPAT